MWDSYSIAAVSFFKWTVMEATNKKHNFDTTCFLETHIDSSTGHDNKRLFLNVYNQVS